MNHGVGQRQSLVSRAVAEDKETTFTADVPEKGFMDRPRPARSRALPRAALVHTTPLSWEHIGLSGDFLWDHAAATADKRRPLNLRRIRAAA
jgi:hypothetical protein